MMEFSRLQEGMSYTSQRKVDSESTNVNLFSTSALIGAMIETAIHLVRRYLPEGYMTVAKKIEVYHENPSLQGMTITVQAKLEKIEGNVLYIHLVCFDEVGEIARGKQERHIVHQNGLIKKAKERAQVVEEKAMG